MEKYKYGFIFAIGCCIIVGVFYPIIIYARSLGLTEEFERLGIQHKTGLVESPALIIPVDRAFFLRLAVESGVVYSSYDSIQLFVFNEDMTVAYKYTVKIFE